MNNSDYNLDNDITEVNTWYADKCGFSTEPHIVSGKISVDINGCLIDWTIEDDRCMKVIRERFKITTKSEGQKWRVFIGAGYLLAETGKTIAEAELACLMAIYNARGE